LDEQEKYRRLDWTRTMNRRTKDLQVGDVIMCQCSGQSAMCCIREIDVMLHAETKFYRCDVIQCSYKKKYNENTCRMGKERIIDLIGQHLEGVE
jgi:hypothetical protein